MIELIIKFISILFGNVIADVIADKIVEKKKK